jgi:hypothetical protein
MNKVYTYKMSTEIFNNKIRAIYTRSDGFMVTSSWWGIDDGSAEQDACERMRQKENTQTK